MKRQMIYIAVLLTAVCLAQSKEVIVTGKINQVMAKTAYLREMDPYDPASAGKAIDSATIDTNGVFLISLKLQKPVKYTLGFGQFNAIPDLYLWPDDSLYIDIQFGEQTMNYNVFGKGEGYLANKLYTDFSKQFSVTPELAQKYQQVSQSDTIDLLIDFISSHKDKQIDYINKYSSKVPENVKAELIMNIEYDWASTVLSRLIEEMQNQYQSNAIVWDHKQFSAPVLAKVKLNNPDAARSNAYRIFLDRHLMINFLEYYFGKAKEGTELSVKDSYGYLFSSIRNQYKGVALDLEMSKLFNDLFAEMKTNEEYEFAKVEFQKFRKEAKDKGFLPPIEKLFDTQRPLTVGMAAPAFSLPDSTGKMISLSDFKGKVVYIDFWGTWCGPCRKEIPALKELHTKFEANKDVVFMSLALEHGDMKAWKDFVRSQALHGVQLYVDRSNREISQKYRIVSVPTFMLIDKNGNIANPNAKRPSEPGIEDDIKKLLQ